MDLTRLLEPPIGSSNEPPQASRDSVEVCAMQVFPSPQARVGEQPSCLRIPRSGIRRSPANRGGFVVLGAVCASPRALDQVRPVQVARSDGGTEWWGQYQLSP